jgi:transglutaminase-like putative cysteine protease
MSLIKHITLYCFISLFYLHPAVAGDPDYAVSTIPAALKEKAHAVKRMEEILVDVSGSGDVIITHRYAITILDENGDKFARMTGWYDKLRDIRSVKGTLFDAAGKQIKRLKQSDIEDVSAVDAGSLMTDNRLKSHSFYYHVYPHTVEYEVETKQRYTFSLPEWIPQEDEKYAVENSRLVVNTPLDFKLRYRSFNYKGEPVVTTNKDIRTYTWETKGITSLPDERYCPEWYLRTTSVLLAPSSFEFQQYKGTMNSWEELSSFVYTLNKGRDQLPENIKQLVHQQTDGLSREEKITKLYRYLQQHTRYISVQLGIGGMQTFDANYVAGNGYGDCKALSNYMCALLKEAGITASMVLVQAGDENTTLVDDFPSNQFNHVIVCVPGAKDTTWLECTSSDLPAGYLSGFTANRPVLILSEAGSKLVHTPDYNIEQNLQIRHVTATVNDNGDMLVNASTHYTGLQQDDLLQKLHGLSREKLLEELKRSALLPSYDVNKYECKEVADQIPAIDEQIELAAHNYASVSGKRMFILPNLLNKSAARPESEAPRLSEVWLRMSYRDVDTVMITVPAGYTPEAIPLAVSLQSPFGTYTSRATVDGAVITYIRTINRKGGIYPATSYPDLETFYNAIYKADRARIVLVKN